MIGGVFFTKEKKAANLQPGLGFENVKSLGHKRRIDF
jgi:hypothetical protein